MQNHPITFKVSIRNHGRTGWQSADFEGHVINESSVITHMCLFDPWNNLQSPEILARTSCQPVFLLLQNFQGNEAMFEAVEQQDLDAVQLLLYQYTPEELDLNTPNSEGLTPLDIAIMTNNVPIARILLRTGARESPHCE